MFVKKDPAGSSSKADTSTAEDPAEKPLKEEQLDDDRVVQAANDIRPSTP